MAKKARQAYQYEAPVTPSKWTGEEQRFSIRVKAVLEDLYQKFSSLSTNVSNARSVESVNGITPDDAGNVALGAADVGALASAYKSSVDSLIKRWKEKIADNYCTDIDNPVETGFYHIDTNTAGTKPSEHGDLLHITENPIWSEHQLYFASHNAVFHRHRNNNGTANSVAWSAWNLIVSNSNAVTPITQSMISGATLMEPQNSYYIIRNGFCYVTVAGVYMQAGGQCNIFGLPASIGRVHAIGTTNESSGYSVLFYSSTNEPTVTLSSMVTNIACTPYLTVCYPIKM